MRSHLAAHALTERSKWPQIPFRRLATLVTDRNVRADEPLLSVASSGLVSERVGEGRQGSSDGTVAKSWVAKPGDLVVNPMWLIGGGIAVTQIRGAVSPDYRVYRFHQDAHPRYMHHLLRTPEYVAQYRLYTRADTTFDRRVSKQDFHELPVLLPPIDEQRRIAEFLDDQVALLDQAIMLRQQQAVLVKERFHSLRRGYLDDLVRLQGLVALRHVIRCLDGQRVPLNREERSYRSGSIPYWGAGNIVDHIDEALFDEPLVLLGEDGAPFFDPLRDVAFVVREPVWVNNHIHVLRPLRGWEPEFLAHALNAVDYSAHITGATRDKLTQEDMRSIGIPNVDQASQRIAIDTLGLEAMRTARLVDLFSQQESLLKERKRSLITAAVTGEFDVTAARVVSK